MPLAVFTHLADGSEVSATTVSPRRALIPGVEPGGSKVGQPLKPALLIVNAWVQVIDINLLSVNALNMATMDIVLSQEVSMDPQFVIPVAQIGMQRTEETTVGFTATSLVINNLFHEHGSIWAPRFVASRIVEEGTITEARIDLFLEYEMVEIPWVEWFIKWDFLDGIPHLSREH